MRKQKPDVQCSIGDEPEVSSDRLAADMSPDQHQRYDSLINAITAQARTFATDGVPAANAARIIADAIANPHPRARYTIGRDAAISHDSPA